MVVYVFCHNAQSESHSDPHDICTLSLLYQLPDCNLFTQHVVISYGETPLENCGPRSNFLYIAITIYYYSLYLHSCILLPFTTRYAQSFVYSKSVRLITSS
jgi:hypothetical protein